MRRKNILAKEFCCGRQWPLREIRAFYDFTVKTSRSIFIASCSHYLHRLNLVPHHLMVQCILDRIYAGYATGPTQRGQRHPRINILSRKSKLKLT